MPAADSLQRLLHKELRSLRDAERRLTKAIPKMVKASTAPALRKALKKHWTRMKAQISHLERAIGRPAPTTTKTKKSTRALKSTSRAKA